MTSVTNLIGGVISSGAKLGKLVMNPIAISPKPAGTPSKYCIPEDLHGLNVEYTNVRAAAADMISAIAASSEPIRR